MNRVDLKTFDLNERVPWHTGFCVPVTPSSIVVSSSHARREGSGVALHVQQAQLLTLVASFLELCSRPRDR